MLIGFTVNAQNLVNKAVNATISGSGNNLSNLKDNNPSTDWYATYNGSNYLLATFTNAIALNGMGLSANGNGTEDAAKNETPKNITISGSNDNSSFTQLGGWTGLTWDRKGASKLFSFNNTTAYKYYKLSITETATNSGNESLSEWQLFDNMGIAGKVYIRNTLNSLYGFGNVSGDKGASGVNVSIVDENRSIIKTVTTDSDGSYSFSGADISYSTLSGDFSIIVTPPSGYRFVSDPALTYTSYVSGKSNYANSRLQIQADGVFPFLSLETKYLTNFNNKRYVSNSRFSNTLTSLDFGLFAATGVDFTKFYPSGY
ncbi:MAG: hypothetical protein DI598_19595, partial [Pseudopedobacter saltans]